MRGDFELITELKRDRNARQSVKMSSETESGGGLYVPFPQAFFHLGAWIFLSISLSLSLSLSPFPGA